MIRRVFVPQETTACSLGADEVARKVAAELAKHSIDAALIRNGSRGAFHLEPLLEVEVGGERLLFGPVSPADVEELFDAGCLPGRGHESCLGCVEDIPFLANQTRLTFARAGSAAPLDFSAYRNSGGLRALERALAMEPVDVVKEIELSGLRGRGGAAFPAAIKWQTVLAAPGAEKYVVCNADEGDSGTFADRLLMECDPYQLLEAMAVAGVTIGAAQGYIYLRSEYPRAHEVLREAISRARAAGLLGADLLGSGIGFDIELRLGAGSYICGEETAMLESIEGKRGIVRAKPPLPALAGLFGKPTLVHNVLTLAAVTSILVDGGVGYAAHGTARSRGTMPFQLGGNVACGGLVELPFGLPLRDLFAGFACGTQSGRELKAIQVGGPLGAYLAADQWDLPLDYEAFAAAGAMIGHGGVVAFDDSADMAAQAEFAMRFCAAESCGKCTPCRIGSQRGEELIQRIRLGDTDERNFQLLEDLLETMELGSLCALGGLTPMPIRSILDRFPDALRAPNVVADD
jgi:formate dehydrogenase iron-sulfur subunit